MPAETVTGLDEAKILGYFESLRGIFLSRFLMLASFTHIDGPHRLLDAARIHPDTLAAAQALFPDPLFYASLARGNAELVDNLLDDLATTTVTSSWNCFEQIIKDLLRTDYALQTGDLSVGYQNARFQFSTRERKDLDFIYYTRNAIVHYNGAYHAAKSVNHRYRGMDFVSAGHEGEKMPGGLELSFHILEDLERYGLKAWSSAQALKAGRGPA